MSPERKPGDEDILAAQAPRPQFALRVLSVLPFILFGAFSVIAALVGVDRAMACHLTWVLTNAPEARRPRQVRWLRRPAALEY